MEKEVKEIKEDVKPSLKERLKARYDKLKAKLANAKKDAKQVKDAVCKMKSGATGIYKSAKGKAIALKAAVQEKLKKEIIISYVAIPHRDATIYLVGEVMFSRREGFIKVKAATRYFSDHIGVKIGTVQVPREKVFLIQEKMPEELVNRIEEIQKDEQLD